MKTINEIKLFLIIFITLKLLEKGLYEFFGLVLIVLLIDLVIWCYHDYFTEKDVIKRVDDKLKKEKQDILPYPTGRLMFDIKDNPYAEFLTFNGTCDGCDFNGEHKSYMCFNLCRDGNNFIYKKRFPIENSKKKELKHDEF